MRFALYHIFVLLTAVFPAVSFAQGGGQSCFKEGYTITTINGVITDKQGAIGNMVALSKKFGPVWNDEIIDYQYLLNESHGGGIFDLTDSARQAFLGQTSDYDLVNMLNDASDKITTQKVLLVAHSQGNFYANNFYDRVADQVGGIPSESLGVYGVASPAGRVAGGGKYITSSTDNIINSVRIFSDNVLPSNATISLKSDDTSFVRGHPFSSVYLAGEGARIITEIQDSLDKLSADPERLETVRCLEPQEVGIGHHITGVTLATTDLLATATIKTGVIAYNSVIFTAKFAYNSAKIVGVSLYSFAGSILSATLETLNELRALVINASHPTQETINNITPSSTAAVILAIDQKSTNNPNPPLIVQITKTETQESLKTTLSTQDPTPTNKQIPTTQNKPLQLVFVGATYPGFGGGAPVVAPQVLAYSSGPLSESEPASEPVLIPEVDPIETSSTLEAPVISAPQCEYSLAIDGCLVATTTIQFSWPSDENVAYYTLDKNGEFATTTETFFNTNTADFSDYTLSISAIGTERQITATSSKTISIATIPVAINEIAWMGTQHSSSDEWMELKNNTNYFIDLSNWSLASEDNTPEIALSGSIKPYGFVLLERTDDTTIRDIAADIIYSGSLKNSGEILRLAYASSTIDQTPSGSWAAGSNTESYDRKTMERVSPRSVGSDPLNWTTWGSMVEFIRNGEGVEGSTILGTPKGRNSVNYTVLNNGEDIRETLTLARDSGYYIPYSMAVATSGTLTLEEGVDIFVANDLVVEGVINAKGTEQNPVHFIGLSESPGPFKPGIIVDNTEATSTFSHILVEGINGITADTGNIIIKDSTFNNNDYGIVLFNGSTAEITNTKFSRTTDGEALLAFDGSILNIASSTITDSFSGSAIEVFDGSILSLATTTIENISEGNGIKVYNATASLNNVTIENVENGDGLRLTDSTTTISNTTIAHGAEGDAIITFGGSTTITDSTISDFPNGAGVHIFEPNEPVIVQNTSISGVDTLFETYSPSDVIVLSI